MSKRSFLYSAAFIGLVAATGAIAPPAQAQKGIALQPATQWAINKVEANGSQNPYCAAARRFRPNTILTFARNSNDEASFALDFQSPKFRQAEGMEVRLDPGAGQQRAFEVYPVSNQAFVIRLGRDQQFFSALEKTGFLRVEFDGKAYHFDLSDIDVGQDKLATCIANAVVPAAGDEGSPVVAESSDQFQKDVDDLRRQLAKLRNDNRRMSGATPVSDEYETDGSEIEMDELSRQVTQLEIENRELKTKLEAINAGNIEALRSPKDVSSIERLTRENQQLRAALETEQAQDIQEEVLHDQIRSLEEENQSLRSISTQSDASGVADKDILALIQENDTLKEQLASIATAAGDEDLPGTIAKLEKENRALKEGEILASEDSQAQIEALKRENKRLQGIMESTVTSGDPAIVVQELKGRVDRLSADMKVKESKLLEMSKLATEVEILKTTNEELEKQLIESALRGPTSARTMTQKIAALETQNDSLLQKIQSEADVATSADTATLDTLKAENEQLKKTISDNQTLIDTNKTLQAEVEKLRKENDELKQMAAANSGGVDAAELQKLKDDNETLRTQLQQKETELAELSNLRQEVERLRRENDELRARPAVESTNSPIPGGAPNPEVENLTRENENLRQQIANMNVAGKDTEITELKARLAEQETKIAAADEALKKAEESARTAKDDAAKAKKEAKAAAKKAEEEKKVAEAVVTPAASPVEQAIAAKVETKNGNVEDELIRAAASNGASPIPPAPEEKVAEAAPPQEELQPAPVNEAQAQEQRAEEITWNAAPAQVEAEPAPEPVPQGVAISPEPLSPPVMEQEMIRLEKKLGEAKASGDQMAIQQAARDYMNLKSRMSPSQELAASSRAPAKGPDASKDLLGYAGTAKAPVADVQAETMVSPPPSAPDASAELLAAGQPVEDAQAQEQALRPAGEVALPDASSDEYRARINDSRMVTPESVQQSYDASKDLMKGSTDGMPSAEWAQATPANVNTSAHGGVYQPTIAVPQILGNANVVSPQAVAVVPNASGSDKVAYQWKSDKVFGSAIQRPLSDPSRFDGEVQAYLEQTKKRCGQDFAAVADGTTNAGSMRIDTYEIACVGKGVSSSASLIFFSKEGTFTVLAHEAPTTELESAMDIRDKLVRTLKGS